MMPGEDRGRLDRPPESMTGPPPGARAPGEGVSAAPSASSGFELNHPTIISLLYLSSFLLGITALVGVVLAYVWRQESHADWEATHYRYLINTFWIALLGSVASVLLMLVLIGFLLLPAIIVLVVIRCVLSLINAQKQLPMPNPGTLLA